MAEAMGMMNALYFGGDEENITEEMMSHEGVFLMETAGDEKTAYYLERMLNESGPDDNVLHIGK